LKSFKVHILGCGSALPTLQHYASSQIVEFRDKCFMIDCGEGTQMQVRHTHIHFSKIQAVFISHIHGDHCFGLIGMISTFGMLGRTAPLHIYAPAELESILNAQVELFCTGLEYNIVFHAVDTAERTVIYEDRSLIVETIPLEHRVPCCGFIFREKPALPHIRRDMIDFYNIPISQINNIKAGAGWTTPDGDFVPHERLTVPADAPRSYAYCSDTHYLPHLHELIKGVSTLYHESTYAEDNVEKARIYHHSTAAQAAMVARDANVGKLLLGHYSSRYRDESVLLDEAKAIFPNSYLTNEKLVFDV
jgi:ribonuclease Z